MTKEERKAKQHAYAQTPEAKAKVRARRQTPEYKAKDHARKQTPRFKAVRRAREQTPDAKEKESARARARYNAGGFKRMLSQNHRFTSVRRGANKRGIEFTITREEFFALWPPAGSPCPACLNEMRHRTPHAPSYDRRDNSKGYVSGNVAIICRDCNMLKRDADSNHLHRLGLYAAGLIGNPERKEDPALTVHARAILGPWAASPQEMMWLSSS